MYLTRAKRRRTSNSETSSRARKRGKRQEAPEEHAAAVAADSEEEGKLWSRKILDEKKEKGRTLYLVGWEDHERKSDTWKNEWKVASLVPSGLKKEWEAKKKQPAPREPSEAELSPPPESEEEPSDYEANFERPAARKPRRPRVVESSSQPPEAKTPSPRPDRSLEKSLIEETPDAALDIAASSSLPAPTPGLVYAEPDRVNPSPNIIVTQKSDFNRSDYEIGLSQAKTESRAESSQQTPVHDQNTPITTAGTQLPATIPDSQTQSDIRTTQENLTQQQNSELSQIASVTPRVPGFGHPAQTPAVGKDFAIEDTPQSASSAPVLETDPVEPPSPAIGKHSTRRTKKLAAGLAASEFGEPLTKASGPAIIEESPKRAASRRSSVSRKTHAAGLVAVSSQQQSLPSTRSRLSKVEAVDFQEAQSRDRATEHWVSVLSADQAADSSPSALSFSERLKDQLQSTAPEKDISALQQSPAALFAPVDENKRASRDPDRSAWKVSERTEISFDMPKTRRSLRTAGDLNISQDATSTPAASASNTPKTARGGRGGISTRKTKKITEETPQKGFDKPAEIKRRGRPPIRYRQTAVRGGSIDSQTDSEAQASAVPAEEPVEPAAVETDSAGRTHLPARMPADEGDDTMDTRENEDMEVDSQSGEQSSTESEGEADSGPSLEQMEFMVPLPMAGQARDQYRRTVKFNEELIDRFTSRKWREYDGILKQAEDFVQTMHDIVAHIDLTNNTTLSQSDVDPADVVEWDRSVSPKFKFLWHLFDVLRGQKIHIVIMVKPGRLLDILENFLKGNHLRYSRPDVERESEGSSIFGALTVTLLSTSGEGSTAAVRPANLILSLDHVVDVKNPRIQALRTNPTQPKYLAPVASLAIVNSVDHIERSLTPNLTGAARVRVLVNCIAKLRRNAGKTEGKHLPIDESAMEAARFVLMGGTEDQWPLPPIGPLDNNDAWDLTQGLTSMKSSQSSDSEKSAKAKAALKSQKRRAERIQDEKQESGKKLRMTPQAEQDTSITRISDSVAGNSSLLDKTPTDSQEMIALRNLLNAAEENLQTTLKSKDARIRDLESALGDLQFRFEEQTTEKRILVRDMNQVRTSLEITQKQKESRDITIDKLKEENRELKTQLSEARAALDGSAIPEVAAAEKLRQEAEQAQEAKRKAEKESASQGSLNGYLSQQYNEASSRAADLANQNNELESRIKVLEKTASGEIAKARQLFMDEQQNRTAMENARLKSQVANLNALLNRKEEEIKNKKAGVGTRAGSVPRSPRVGPSSRANSPIPDRRIGALKNNLNFQGRRQTSRPARLEEPQSQDSPTSQNLSPAVTQATYAAPVIQEPKPKPGRPIEIKMMEAKVPDVRPEPPRPEPRHEQRQVESKMPPEPIPPAPRPEMRQSSMNTRPFPCCFAQYNCGSAFTSKNEWKRHISTKHIQLGFWRCDMCPPSPGIDHPIYNDFNRKDLFTQHLRRMHAVNTPQNTQDQPKAIAPSAPPGGGPPVAPPNTNPPGLSDEQIMDIQKRCYRQLRQPPEVSSCVFCPRTFTGPNSWEERLEHVGGHLERDRKNGTACLDVNNWRPDPALRDYLVVEGLVEYDPRGGYRIGDGKPRRPLDIEGFAGQQPTTQLTPRPNNTTDAIAGAATDPDSEGSNEKRRRGRAPKKQSDVGPRVEIMELDPPPSQSQPQSQPPPPTSQPQEPSRSLPLPSPSHNGPMRSPSAHQLYGPGPPMQSPGMPQNSPGYQPSQEQMQRRSPGPDPRDAPPPRPNTTPGSHPQQQQLHPMQMAQQQQQLGPQQSQQQQQQNAQPGQPQYGQPQQAQQQQGPPQQPPQQQSHPQQQQQQQQLQMPPSNIQPMYQFRHGTFTKFQGTASADRVAQPIWPSHRPQELPAPALSTRANPGQPQLAPRPPPDPRDAILARIWSQAPSLRPPGYQEEQPQLPSMPPRAPVHHSGFKAINESQAALNRVQESMHQLAPKPPSDGTRQLAPKPLQHPSQSPQEQQKAMPPMQPGPRPITPQPLAVVGAERDREGEKSQNPPSQSRGKSFHQVVMS